MYQNLTSIDTNYELDKKTVRASSLLIIDKHFSITLKTVKPQEI